MKHSKEANNRILIPSILAIGIIPLIIHVFYYDSQLSQFVWFPDNSDQASDYFLGWKMIAIIIIGIIMAVTMLFRHLNKKDKLVFENAFYLLFMYALFVGMSALFSNYKHWVNAGSYQVFESVWVIFSYLIFCYYTYQYVQDAKQVTALLKWGGIGVLILILIGAFQFLGFDFFKSTIGKMLITNPSTWGSSSQISFNTPKHTVYATLYNQNYLSFYFGLLIPIIIALLLACKQTIHRVFLIIICVLAVMCLIGASSSSGWIALVLAGIVTSLVLASRRKKSFIIVIVTYFIIAILGIVICVVTPIGDKVDALFVGTADFPSLKSIDTTGDCVQMNIDGNILKLSFDLDENTNEVSIHMTDADDQTLQSLQKDDDPSISVIQNEGYKNCEISAVMYDDKLALSVNLDDHLWYFTKNEQNNYVIINQAGKLEEYKSANFSTLFRDDAISGRGHIWDGIIPVLSKYIFAGNGANTFMFAYPQNDYIYRAYYEIPNIFDVKAHNLYLQQWVENGMLAMLAFISFYFWYAIVSIRIYRKIDFKNPMAKIGFGVFVGTMVYMFVGLANDSNVCTAPVFWVILGLGMAINRILKEHDVVISNIFKKDEEQEQLPSNTIAPQKSLNKKSSRKARKKH